MGCRRGPAPPRRRLPPSRSPTTHGPTRHCATAGRSRTSPRTSPWCRTPRPWGGCCRWSSAPRGSLDQVNHDIACHYAQQHSTSELVAELRDQAASCELPKRHHRAEPGDGHRRTARTWPCRCTVTCPYHRTPPATPCSAPGPWAGRSTPAGGWPATGSRPRTPTGPPGDGPLIAGTTVALLLLATGRVTAALPLLHGPGVPCSPHPHPHAEPIRHPRTGTHDKAANHPPRRRQEPTTLEYVLAAVIAAVLTIVVGCWKHSGTAIPGSTYLPDRTRRP